LFSNSFLFVCVISFVSQPVVCFLVLFYSGVEEDE
jgi:hypothetical protein